MLIKPDEKGCPVLSDYFSSAIAACAAASLATGTLYGEHDT